MGTAWIGCTRRCVGVAGHGTVGKVIADTLEEFLEKIVDPDHWTDLVDDDEW